MLFIHIREEKIINKKFKTSKFIGAILTTSLLVTSISNLANNYDNVANAQENIQTNELSQKNIEEANIIKDYIKLEEKNGLYKYQFINDDSLNKRLKKINSNLNDNLISEYIAYINDILAAENGKGILTNSINQARKEANLSYNKIPTNYNFKSACSWSFWGLGGYVGGIYQAVSVLATSNPIGWAGFAAGLAIGAVGNIVCK